MDRKCFARESPNTTIAGGMGALTRGQPTSDRDCRQIDTIGLMFCLSGAETPGIRLQAAVLTRLLQRFGHYLVQLTVACKVRGKVLCMISSTKESLAKAEHR
jgi:hypothetical protein